MDPISNTKPKLYTPIEPEPQAPKAGEKPNAPPSSGPTGNRLMDAVAPPPSWGANVVQFYANAMKPMPEQSSGTVPQSLMDRAKDPAFQSEICKTAVPMAAKAAGGYVGGQAGAAAGFEAGALVGPEGAAAGALAGKTAGKHVGEKIGQAFGDKAAAKYCPKPPAEPSNAQPKWPTPQLAPPKGAPTQCAPPPPPPPPMSPVDATVSNPDGTVS